MSEIIENLPGLILLIGVFALCGFVFWSLVDCLRRPMEGRNRLLGVILILVIPPFGSILYLYVLRDRSDRAEPTERPKF